MDFTDFPQQLLDNINVLWTFMLLLVRFTAFFYLIPGIGEGLKGIVIRAPAILVLAYSSLHPETYTQMPENEFIMLAMFVSEILFGVILGIIPLLIVVGIQTAAQLASTSMGLGAAQLFDPTSGTSVSDLSRILGDLTIIMFLMIDGHHVAIQAVSGFGGKMVAGSFIPSEITTELIVNRVGEVFHMAVMLSAPVIVALLLTQFVMGLISKAVPTVNIFIISFPLTIGIGLLLTTVALPDMMRYISRQWTGIENSMIEVSHDATINP